MFHICILQLCNCEHNGTEIPGMTEAFAFSRPECIVFIGKQLLMKIPTKFLMHNLKRPDELTLITNTVLKRQPNMLVSVQNKNFR